jgi:hypothetical protein
MVIGKISFAQGLAKGSNGIDYFTRKVKYIVDEIDFLLTVSQYIVHYHNIKMFIL